MATFKSPKNRFLFLVSTSIAGVIALTLVDARTQPTNNPNAPWTQSRASQLVFFAVLEGLYRDGVANSVVDLIIPPGEDGKPAFDREHFVYACPLCHPAFDAFRLYRQREEFFGFKARVDTFGPGLDPALTVGLRSHDAGQRRQAIEGLINRWVRQRLDMMRLSAAEREAITREMEQGRKQGMNGLKQASQSRTNCPICDGSFGACKLQAH
ncbi:MAG TPA: hypothetical protein VN578_17585 [Candidatus Binatia bacterium]|jgi:hypothetical protein|nr:hypothetical protein [Candidatus Binatia bacterium]